MDLSWTIPWCWQGNNMSVSILRWKGGYGGDMLLYMKSLSQPDSVANVVYQQVDSSGKTMVDFSGLDFANLREIDKMASTPARLEQINQDKLAQEITEYDQQTTTVWLKSHYYKTDMFNDHTLDLVVDAVSLPFVISSCVTKTDVLTRNFNDMVGRITEDSVRLKYCMYMVGKDSLHNIANIGAHRLPVSSLLMDVTTFAQAVGNTNLDLDPAFFHVYQYWLDHNQERLPSRRYRDRVMSKDFDFMDIDLTLAERYSLLILSGNRFVNL